MGVVRYIVEKVDESVAFYTKQLGFNLKEDWGPVAVLSKGDLDLWISGPASSAGKTLVDQHKPAPGGANRLVLVVQNLTAQVEALKAAGTRSCSDLVKGRAGAWILIADPSGNPIELFEPK